MTPVEVWARMAEMYGERWTSLMGDEPNDMWAAGINKLTDDQVARGFKALIEEGGEHPPGLPTFLKKCKAATLWDTHVPRLPNPLDEMSIHKTIGNGRLFKALWEHHMGDGEPISEEKIRTVILPALNKIVAMAEEMEADGEEMPVIADIFKNGFEQNVATLL